MFVLLGSFVVTSAVAQEQIAEGQSQTMTELLSLLALQVENPTPERASLIDSLAVSYNAENNLKTSPDATGSTTMIAGGSTGMVTLYGTDMCGFRYYGSLDVMDMQRELNTQGYSLEKIDGKYGPNTTAAVTAFQTKAGIKVDGKFGPQSAAALMRSSVACEGDAGVTRSDATVAPANIGACSIRYQGSTDVQTIQGELVAQGYTVTKVDGKIGTETTAAVSAFQTKAGITADGKIGQATRMELARHSVVCEGLTAAEPTSSTPAAEETNPTPAVENTPTSTTEDSGIVGSKQIFASVRTTSAGIPDDTGVFTYQVTFGHTGSIYVPASPDAAFDMNVLGATTGTNVNTQGVKSIVSSGAKVLRSDGSSYYLLKNGDNLSLRMSIQPGAGDYYAELARLSYTTDNAVTIQSPAMISYGLNPGEWKSTIVTLLN